MSPLSNSHGTALLTTDQSLPISFESQCDDIIEQLADAKMIITRLQDRAHQQG